MVGAAIPAVVAAAVSARPLPAAAGPLLDVVRRTFGNFYDLRRDLSTGTVTDAVGNRYDLGLVEVSNDYRREYTGLHTQVAYRVGRRLNLGGSWTWSHAYGNFDGETGPYVQYAHARILSVLRKAGGTWAALATPGAHDPKLTAVVPYAATAVPADLAGLEASEAQALLFELAGLPGAAEEATRDYQGTALARQLLSIARAFSTASMVYRSRPFVYGDDAYNRWKIKPSVMISDLLLRDMKSAGLFGGVFSGCKLTRITGSTRKPSSPSRGTSAACTSELLPAPDGAYNNTTRSAISKSSSTFSSRSRPYKVSPVRKERGPT